MSRRGGLAIGQLSFDPHIDKPFEHLANLEAQFGDGVDLALEFGVFHPGSIVYLPYGSTAQVAAVRGWQRLDSVGKRNAGGPSRARRIHCLHENVRRRDSRGIRRTQDPRTDTLPCRARRLAPRAQRDRRGCVDPYVAALMDGVAGFFGAGSAHDSCDVVWEGAMASEESADQSKRRNDDPGSGYVSRQQHYGKVHTPDA